MTQWPLFETSAICSAELSDCERYRYRLTRDWGQGRRAVFVMLNRPPPRPPATTRRSAAAGLRPRLGILGPARPHLYAYRATDPRELWKVDDPVGPANDQHLHNCLAAAEVHGSIVVAAWGSHARQDRADAVRRLHPAGTFTALGVTKDGAPRHPLYLRRPRRRVAGRHGRPDAPC